MPDDDTLILRRTALTPEHLSCPIKTCTYILDVPPVPVLGDGVAAVFGLSGRTLATMHAEMDAARAADTMRQHMRIHSPEDWLHLIEHTALIVEVRSDQDQIDSLTGMAAAALAARDASEAKVQRVREVCEQFDAWINIAGGYPPQTEGQVALVGRILRALDGGDA